MAGIYIHIPFCQQACHYCDFHFSTNTSRSSEMVDAICKELVERSSYIKHPIETIYFGGGTPSILSAEELKKIFHTLKGTFNLTSVKEVTLEANPEDLSMEKLELIRQVGINRLSIGVQTFSDERLEWMNRIHSASEAEASFNNARKVGFNNISIDLIYALPNHGTRGLENDLKKATSLGPEHISIYGLTIEDRTVFGKQRREGKLVETQEEEAAQQYLAMTDFLQKHGYQQYEVSNFSRPGFRSQHNASYWFGKDYLGVGPGAHSYNNVSRQFNVRNNAKYITALTGGFSYFETEQLSKTQRMNERILTSLRTIEGINLPKFYTDFKSDFLTTYGDVINELTNQEIIKVENDHLHLSPNGFLVADEVALKLFFDE